MRVLSWLSALGLTLAAHGGKLPSGPVPDRPEAALDFDGANDRVTVPYDDSFATEVFTIGAWVKAPPPGHRSAIIARGEDDDSYNLAWHLYVEPDGSLRLMIENAAMQNFCYPYVCFTQVLQVDRGY